MHKYCKKLYTGHYIRKLGPVVLRWSAIVGVNCISVTTSVKFGTHKSASWLQCIFDEVASYEAYFISMSNLIGACNDIPIISPQFSRLYF